MARRHKSTQCSGSGLNSQTVIHLQLDAAGTSELTLYDSRGRLVRRLWQGLLAPGVHRMVWDGRDDGGRMAATGVYLHCLSHGLQTKVRKMLLPR